MTSLDEIKDKPSLPLFKFLKQRVKNAVLLFYNSPNRIKIGKQKHDFPISYAHLVRESKFFSVFTEEDLPSEICTQLDIKENDLLFQFIWCTINRITDVHDIYDFAVGGYSFDYTFFLTSSEDITKYLLYINYFDLDNPQTIDQLYDIIPRDLLIEEHRNMFLRAWRATFFRDEKEHDEERLFR